MFAFFRRNMFELTPAARRVGERAAIDDLGSPVIIVDDDGRVINANDAARTLFPEGERAVLGRQLDALIDGIDLAADDQTVSITAGTERREYAVATSALADAAGTHLGSTVVLQDITAEKQREQRLTVLNRVLRHNLRNDLNVVQGNLELASRRATDDEVLEVVANARAKTAEVAALGEKARLIERTLDADDRADRPVALASVLADVRRDLLADRDGGQIDVRVPEDCTLRTDPGLLEGVVRNLVENGLDHADASDPAVEVVLTSVDDDGWATLEIRDEGPGLPDHERRVIETGEETDLVHGSGLGLWYVTWAVDALGGHLRFDTGDGGTTVTLRLPGVVDADR
jgi:signal transduction histidine kinase